MTIVDSDLANSLQLQCYDTPDIPIAGIGSKHVSSKFMNVPIFFHGDHHIAKITVEAHMVDNLQAKLLLGIDATGHEDFRVFIWNFT